MDFEGIQNPSYVGVAEGGGSIQVCIQVKVEIKKTLVKVRKYSFCNVLKKKYKNAIKERINLLIILQKLGSCEIFNNTFNTIVFFFFKETIAQPNCSATKL